MDASEAGTILIVDDNPRNLGLLSDTLTGSGFEVAVAVDGARALRLAREGMPDLILLDVKMDGMDGFETCRRLKGDPATAAIPVIFMTASTDLSADRVKGLNLGAVDYLAKPFLDEELLARVRVHTKLRRLTMRLAAQVDERIAAEAALQRLTQELERRVGERTVALERALEGLTQAQAQMATVIRAAQAVSGEIVLDDVLDRLMRLTLEHAGARKCVLVLSRESGLVIEASITSEPDTVVLGLSTPVGPGADLAASLVEEVARTRQSVFVWDTGRDARPEDAQYLAGKGPRSILCLAMMCQGELIGVLYIEGDAAPEPLLATQLETLGLLASQAAVAVKNALLYGHLADMTSELRRSNERLETEVARQTEELRQANERLQRELVERARAEEERARAEEERAALQAEVIDAQSARLAELSTPLIPITDHIMVMPLIGTIDSARAQQALEAALNGVQANRAKVVIIDVTGVTVLDSAVASTLMSTATALRLLGSKTVITGIRAELAQTLIDLGVDLGAVVTKGTLQSGIGYALRQAGDGVAGLHESGNHARNNAATGRRNGHY
ncbi:two-component response regulator [Sorangium cellulosum So ce56]|uniref:Two-component response regulator n=1 Tax=Sorangium cellulosum (strain So ce56) TaxID=448385 RepID=A9FPW2_SORC5|nr:response regulator [Sorangium cellulosum]CAN92097.1 two-component response regulator [Sorangium cellulosum So ce56]